MSGLRAGPWGWALIGMLATCLPACRPGSALTGGAEEEGPPTWPPEVIEARAREANAWEPVVELVERVRDRHFSGPDEVAAGRFLEEFSRKVHWLSRIDSSRLELVRRGKGWVQVLARMNDLTDERRGSAALLRLVKSEGDWKLEDIELVRRKD